MVKVRLLFKADLENITNIKPDDDIRWTLKVKCSNCGEVNDKWVYVNASERVSTGGKGTTNLLIKCKFCRRENSIDVLEPSPASATTTSSSSSGGKKKSNNQFIYGADHSGTFMPMAVFDCRGLELVEFKPSAGFTGQSTVGAEEIYSIDLSEGDFCDIDEQTNTPIGVYAAGGFFRFSHLQCTQVPPRPTGAGTWRCQRLLESAELLQ